MLQFLLLTQYKPASSDNLKSYTPHPLAGTHTGNKQASSYNLKRSKPSSWGTHREQRTIIQLSQVLHTSFQPSISRLSQVLFLTSFKPSQVIHTSFKPSVFQLIWSLTHQLPTEHHQTLQVLHITVSKQASSYASKVLHTTPILFLLDYLACFDFTFTITSKSNTQHNCIFFFNFYTIHLKHKAQVYFIFYIQTQQAHSITIFFSTFKHKCIIFYSLSCTSNSKHDCILLSTLIVIHIKTHSTTFIFIHLKHVAP